MTRLIQLLVHAWNIHTRLIELVCDCSCALELLSVCACPSWQFLRATVLCVNVCLQVLHFVQLYLTGRCQLFDYGSEAANVAAYQQRTPPVVSDAYHMLR